MPEQQHDFEFEFVGLLGLKDPVRPNVKGAIDECYTAGIVEQFNRKNSGRDDCYYEAQFRGQYCTCTGQITAVWGPYVGSRTRGGWTAGSSPSSSGVQKRTIPTSGGIR